MPRFVAAVISTLIGSSRVIPMARSGNSSTSPVKKSIPQITTSARTSRIRAVNGSGPRDTLRAVRRSKHENGAS
jgi:hypothetical protein